jgi:hypothetical protein
VAVAVPEQLVEMEILLLPMMQEMEELELLLLLLVHQ